MKEIDIKRDTVKEIDIKRDPDPEINIEKYREIYIGKIQRKRQISREIRVQK